MFINMSIHLEHYPVEKLKKEILSAIGKHVDLKTHRVFFFGSRVAGIGSERSDIDVGIESQKPIDWLTMGLIKDEVEHIPTLYSIDIVDLAATPEKFQKIAKSSIELIEPL